MMWQETPYTLPLGGAAAISAMSAFYIWRHHRVAATRTVAFIISELVTNALKHTYSDREGDFVAPPSVNGCIELKINNGTGMPEDVDFNTTRSLGLRLVTILAEDQLNGSIELTRAEGTEVRTTFRGEKWRDEMNEVK